mmetsp:Transcript_7552/g.22168  ORF Transcript_7552/g.22168 Transcript_7552/m.22168 type:complete len:236 (+) Transcript_7552:408-1115(+)
MEEDAAAHEVEQRGHGVEGRRGDNEAGHGARNERTRVLALQAQAGSRGRRDWGAARELALEEGVLGKPEVVDPRLDLILVGWVWEVLAPDSPDVHVDRTGEGAAEQRLLRGAVVGLHLDGVTLVPHTHVVDSVHLLAQRAQRLREPRGARKEQVVKLLDASGGGVRAHALLVGGAQVRALGEDEEGEGLAVGVREVGEYVVDALEVEVPVPAREEDEEEGLHGPPKSRGALEVLL